MVYYVFGVCWGGYIGNWYNSSCVSNIVDYVYYVVDSCVKF